MKGTVPASERAEVDVRSRRIAAYCGTVRRDDGNRVLLAIDEAREQKRSRTTVESRLVQSEELGEMGES